jgi:hypothetical protein
MGTQMNVEDERVADAIVAVLHRSASRASTNSGDAVSVVKAGRRRQRRRRRVGVVSTVAVAAMLVGSTAMITTSRHHRADRLISSIEPVPGFLPTVMPNGDAMVNFPDPRVQVFDESPHPGEEQIGIWGDRNEVVYVSLKRALVVDQTTPRSVEAMIAAGPDAARDGNFLERSFYIGSPRWQVQISLPARFSFADLVSIARSIRDDDSTASGVLTLASPPFGWKQVYLGDEAVVAPQRWRVVVDGKFYVWGTRPTDETRRLDAMIPPTSRIEGDAITVRGTVGTLAKDGMEVSWQEGGWSLYANTYPGAGAPTENRANLMKVVEGLRPATRAEWDRSVMRLMTNLDPLAPASPEPTETAVAGLVGSTSWRLMTPQGLTPEGCMRYSLSAGDKLIDEGCAALADGVIRWSKIVQIDGRRFLMALLDESVDSVDIAGAEIEPSFVPDSLVVAKGGDFVGLGAIAAPLTSDAAVQVTAFHTEVTEVAPDVSGETDLDGQPIAGFTSERRSLGTFTIPR